MPTYSYKCTECGHPFDAFQSIKEEPLKECPECNGSVERMIGAGAGIVFKGSGFYVTDYKKQGAGSDTGSPSGGGTASQKNGASRPSQSKAATAVASES